MAGGCTWSPIRIATSSIFYMQSQIICHYNVHFLSLCEQVGEVFLFEVLGTIACLPLLPGATVNILIKMSYTLFFIRNLAKGLVLKVPYFPTSAY